MEKYKDLYKVIKKYFSYAAEFKKYFYLAVLGQITGTIFAAIIAPLILKYIVDDISLLNYDRIWYWFILLSLTIVTYRFSFYYTAKLLIKYENSTQAVIANSTFATISQKDYYFFANEQSGAVIAKFDRYVSNFEKIIDTLIYNLLGAVIALLGILITLSFESILFSILFLLFFIIFITLFFKLNRKKLAFSEERASKKTNVISQLSDSLMNALTFIAFGHSEYENNQYQSKDAEYRIAVDKEWTYNNNMWAILYSLLSILTILSYGLTIYLWTINEVGLGTFILISSFLSSIFFRLGDLGTAIGNLTTNLTDALEMVEILDKPNNINDNFNSNDLKVAKGEILFDNVTFNYTNEGVDEIDNFNLKIKPGESIGLVGHSGAGKSTIVKLLLRFVDVAGGSIKIDDQDIRDVTQESLRKSIGYVPQEPLLFHRTIHENIAYGKPDATVREVIIAAEKAKAHEFIKDLPDGYDTLVGERGVKLSGGQRQRIAIARAILKNAPILILDEATSSLDSKSERDIQAAISNLIKADTSLNQSKKTVIAIAHRLSTIKHLDRIIVLEKGRIIEEGTHDSLLKIDGVYADLWNHQQGGFIE